LDLHQLAVLHCIFLRSKQEHAVNVGLLLQGLTEVISCLLRLRDVYVRYFVVFWRGGHGIRKFFAEASRRQKERHTDSDQRDGKKGKDESIVVFLHPFHGYLGSAKLTPSIRAVTSSFSSPTMSFCWALAGAGAGGVAVRGVGGA